VKTALLALVLTTITPAHIRFTLFGTPMSLPVCWLLAAAELLAAAGGAWLTIRVLRRFRSSPYPRLAWSTS